MASFTTSTEGLMAAPQPVTPASSTIADTVAKLKHPYVVFFHLFFRTAALVSYLFCTLFSDSFVLNFVIIVLLLALDFWTVKNVSGRLLVGLRWWNHVDANGSSKWVFESAKDTSRIDAMESNIFWWTLYIYPLLWLLFSVGSVFGFNLQWLIIDIVALVLNGANVYGYSKCNSEAKTKLQNMAGNFITQQAWSHMASRFSGAGSGSAA